jgi:VanZ family protein
MRYRKAIVFVLGAAYLLTMAFFAFRPFGIISGKGYVHADMKWMEDSVYIQRDAAFEDRLNKERIRDALMMSRTMSLEAVIQSDLESYPYRTQLFGFSQQALSRNFSLMQEGNGIEFRLRTTATDQNGMLASLQVPQVFDPTRKQHLVVTYDGAAARLYVDGVLQEKYSVLRGGFDNWGINQALVIGDEPPGGYPWAGRIWRIAIYDRALGFEEVRALYESGEATDALIVYDFESGASTGTLPPGLQPLHYRNLFVTTDPAAYNLHDGLFNVIGFVPLGMLVYLALPVRLERRKIIAAIVVPALVGLLASGSIEFMQRYIATRVPCLPDLYYNMTGSVLGGLLGWLAFSTFSSKSTDGSKK